MSFKYEEVEKVENIPSLSKNLLLGTNLIMMLTTPSKAEKDTQFLKEQLQKYTEFSRFNILVLIYANDINETSEVQNKMLIKFHEEKKLEKIANLTFVPLCFTQFTNRK